MRLGAWFWIIVGIAIGIGMASLTVGKIWMMYDEESLFDEKMRTYTEIERLKNKIEEFRLVQRSMNNSVSTMQGIAEELRQRCR